MKIWSKFTIIYLIVITCLILILGCYILSVKVWIQNGTTPEQITGYQYIKQYGFWNTLKFLDPTSHKYWISAFDPVNRIQTADNYDANSRTFISSGLNILIIAIPFMIIVDIFVSRSILKATYYPTPDSLIELKRSTKKEFKTYKENYKNEKSHVKNKKELQEININYKKQKIAYKIDKINIRNSIKISFKSRKSKKRIK